MYKVHIKCRQPAKNWLLRVLSRLLFWELQKGAKDKVRNHRLLLHPSHPLDKENSFIISTQLRGNRRWVPPVNMCPFLSVLTFYFYWLLWYLGFYIAESFLEILVGTIKLKLGLHCTATLTVSDGRSKLTQFHAAILAGTPVDPGTRIPSWFIPQATHTICLLVNEPCFEFIFTVSFPADVRCGSFATHSQRTPTDVCGEATLQ